MTKPHKSMIVGAAVAGLFAGSMAMRVQAATSVDLSKAGTLLKEMGDKGKHDCKGKNACKGQGGCKTADHDCKGKNSCKGKGGCSTMEKPKS